MTLSSLFVAEEQRCTQKLAHFRINDISIYSHRFRLQLCYVSPARTEWFEAAQNSPLWQNVNARHKNTYPISGDFTQLFCREGVAQNLVDPFQHPTLTNGRVNER